MTREEIEDRHQARPRRHELGRSALFNRPLYGWDAGCSCGWKQKSNESRRYAMQSYRRHLKQIREIAKLESLARKLPRL